MEFSRVRLLYQLVSHNQRLQTRRHPMFEKNMAMKILSYIFIAFVILMFVLSIINLRGALTKSDIMVIGIKEMIFVSALADAVIIQEFLYKVIPYYRDLPFMKIINSYFPLIIALAMIMVPIYMFKRLRQYEA